MQNIEKLYVIAMDSEAKDLLENFDLIQEIPFKLYQNKNDLLAITKVGKVNAAFVLSYLIAKYNIKKIINLGFAGANGSFEIGDIYAVENAKYHDFDATIFGYDLGQVPGLPTAFKSNKDLLNKVNYPKTNLYTGDYFMTETLPDNYLVDMEGAALYQVAYLNNLPIIAIKVVSDVIGRTTHIEEYNDFEQSGSKIIKKIFDLIQEVL